MTREEFESILKEVYIEGYNTAIEDIQEDILDEEAFDLEREYEYYTEGVIADTKTNIKTWYKRRLTSDEIKEAEKEFVSIIKKIKLPKEVHFHYNLFNNKLKPLSISTNKVHLLDKNSIASFNIKYSLSNKSKEMSNIINNIILMLNKNSKKYKFVVHKRAISLQFLGYTGEIFAYRKKDNIEKDMPWNKSDKIQTLMNLVQV